MVDRLPTRLVCLIDLIDLIIRFDVVVRSDDGVRMMDDSKEAPQTYKQFTVTRHRIRVSFSVRECVFGCVSKKSRGVACAR